MAAKACDIFRFPPSDIILGTGDDLFIKLSVTNCGNETGNFYYEIFLDGHRCDSRHNVWLDPGQDSYDVLRCDLVMGTRDKTFEQAGGHAEGGKWVEDFHYKHTIILRTYTLSISPTTHSSPASGDTFNISVTSNTAWSADEYKSWIRCTPTSGSGNGTVSVTVDANTSTSSRTGTICFSRNGVCRNCVITQAAFIPTLSISPNTHSSPASGDTFIINITSNIPWNAYTYKTWLSCSPTSGTGNGTTTITVEANTETSSRTGTFYVTHDGKTRSCAITQAGLSCNCTSWQDAECVEPGKRRQTRTCNPAGCDIEERIIDDSTCIEPPCSQQFTVEDADTSAYITGATVTVGGVDCSEHAEYYQINDLTEGLWYNVIASKSDYTCPDDICKNTFQACGSIITLKLKAPAPPCSEHTDEYSCTNAGCYWYDGACHEFGPVECSDYTDAITCEANLCHWWADGTCHDYEEPTLGKIVLITCNATKEAEEKYEIEATVTIKNINDVTHEYYIRMYDDATGNHLDDEPDAGGIHIEPGKTTDIELTTYGKPVTATTPSIRFDLWETTWINEPVESQTIACTEKELGKIIDISCTSTEEAENDYEIEALVKFKNPDTISHLYKVELLDAETGDHKDWEPDPYQAGKEVGPGETSTIAVNTIGTTNCISPKILIKLWETTGLLAVVDEQEKDCSEPSEPSLWASLILWISDALGISESQSKLIAYGGIGLVSLLFLSSILKR